jgi:hypothetical protein
VFAAEPLRVRYRQPDGRAVISVTQILTLAGRINSEWFTPESALRGTIVHDLTEAYDRGDTLDIPKGLEPYIEAYADFIRTVRPVYAESEVKVVHPTLGFGGRIDRVCDDLFGAPGILDFKTSPAYAWHGQQLAAYNVLRPVGNRWACYLKPNGRYKLATYHDPADHRKFMYDLAQKRGTVLPDGEYWIAAA